jgi:WD40 repeat protein
MPSSERLFIDGFYDTGEHAVVAFSPDGAFATGIEPEGGWVYDVSSHAMREIDDMALLEEPTDVAWSPASDAILVTSEDGLSLCVRQGEGFAFLGTLDDSAGFEAASFIDDTTIVAKRGDALILFSYAAGGSG